MRVGLEVEGFGIAPWYGECDVGEISCDAAPDLLELIGKPDELPAAVQGMQTLANDVEGVAYTYQRPAALAHNTNVWRPGARYVALKRALQKECPDTWQGVNVMTNRAAVHVNVEVDWRSPAGLALLSIVNNIGPQLAYGLQEQHSMLTDGLLSAWQGWANERRHPSPLRWWNSAQELEVYYGRIPRLLRPGGEGESEVEVDLAPLSGYMNAAFHLGTVWLLARPKISSDGTRYIEIRILGSIDPNSPAFEPIVSELYSFVEQVVILCPNGCTQADTYDLFSDLRNRGYEKLVPARLMSWDDWKACPAWGKVDQLASIAV